MALFVTCMIDKCGVLKMECRNVLKAIAVGDIHLKSNIGVTLVLRRVRSENGGEYIGPFDAYYEDKGFGTRMRILCQRCLSSMV